MDTFDSKDIEVVNSRLSDELSKDVFKNRLLFNITNDHYYLKKIIASNNSGKSVIDIINGVDAPLAVFGAGKIGKLTERLHSEKVTAFIDNNKAGEVIDSKPVMSLKEYRSKYPDGYIVIATKYYKDIVKQLMECKYDFERVIDIGKPHYEELAKKQYFDLEIINQSLTDSEVFVDGGAYDGNTTACFFELLLSRGIRKGTSYLWEPDAENVKWFNKTLGDKAGFNYVPVEKGLWSCEETLYFEEKGGTDSRISDKGDKKILVDCIDNYKDIKPTYIKMDIEGAEKEAIEGAKNTIKTYHPKLAICIYHKKEDIIEIPKMILDIDPGYTFYIRHYSMTAAETVLYAI